MTAASDVIRKLGYQPIELVRGAVDSTKERHGRETEELWSAFLGSTFFTLPLLVVAMAPMLFDPVMHVMMGIMQMQSWNWLMLVLAAPVQFWFGWRFLRHGAKKSPELVT